MGAALEIEGLSVVSPQGTILEDVSISAGRGEITAVVGESGSGKSMTALAAMALLPPGVKRISGRVVLHGREIQDLPEREMCGIRGGEIGMIFQEPMTSMNPVLTALSHVAEAPRLHGASRADASARALSELGRAGIPDAVRRASMYPHQLSGGLRQRVMIAAATAARPGVVIADEPTTALDVTVEAGILRLLIEIASEGPAVMLISHDLGVVAETAARIYVMYAGMIVEAGPTGEVMEEPLHPYTRALMGAAPRLGEPDKLPSPIPGSVPRPGERPEGCLFAPRCAFRMEECTLARPVFSPRGGGRSARCILEGIPA